jgi:hypothetical protein
MSEDPHKVMPPPAGDDFERFVQNLAQLSPSAPVRSRNQLLFEAGRASTRVPNLWVWQVAACGFAALSLALGLILLWPGPPRAQVIERERERIVIQYRDRAPQAGPGEFDSPGGPTSPVGPTSSDYAASVPAPPSDSFTEDTRKMLRLRNDVLRFGVEMLPRVDVPSESAPPPTATGPEVSDPIHLPRGTYAAPLLLKRRVPTEDE